VRLHDQIGVRVKSSGPVARRSKSLSSSLGFGEKLFSTASERRFATAIEDGLEKVEAGLLTDTRFSDSLADVTTRYLLEAGGKRVRPTLTLLTAQLGNGINDDVVMGARAIELIHLASLYHDDVMDDAHMRRGVPSAQSVWGNSVAILTGDLLFARASQLVSGLGEDAIRRQADTFERLCLGQLHETVGPAPEEDPIAHYVQVLADKTGSLIATAAEVGVMFSSAPVEFRAPVVEFGEKIGIAFQLVDDVIDLAPQAHETGKVAGTDLRAGVVTLPLLYLRDTAQSDPDAAALLARIDIDGTPESTPSSDADFAEAIATLRNHDVTRRTLVEAKRWSDEAVAALAPLPDGPVKKALSRFAESVVDRSN
jgi:heptaprenyl diphosphate synthase